MERFIQEVITAMQDHLTDYQLQKLENVMLIKSARYELREKSYDIALSYHGWESILNTYLGCKRLENCSEGTIDGYRRTIRMLYVDIGKDIRNITTNDLRLYLAKYVETRHIGLSYRETLRHAICAFFSWAAVEGIIQKDPSKRISRVKVPKTIKKPFTAQDRLKLTTHAKSLRDKALMEVLYSTAGRIGEILALDRDDIKFTDNTGEILIYGYKGKAERKVYLTEQSVFYLRQYLESRDDDNEALFVSEKRPHRRLSKRAVQLLLKDLGEKCGIEAHPHKFRRTLLTDMSKRGANIQDIKEYAGHVNIETTMLYVVTSEKQVKATFDMCIA